MKPSILRQFTQGTGKKIAEIIVLSLAVLTVVFMTFEIVENLTPYEQWGDL